MNKKRFPKFFPFPIGTKSRTHQRFHKLTNLKNCSLGQLKQKHSDHLKTFSFHYVSLNFFSTFLGFCLDWDFDNFRILVSTFCRVGKFIKNQPFPVKFQLYESAFFSQPPPKTFVKKYLTNSNLQFSLHCVRSVHVPMDQRFLTRETFT